MCSHERRGGAAGPSGAASRETGVCGRAERCAPPCSCPWRHRGQKLPQPLSPAIAARDGGQQQTGCWRRRHEYMRPGALRPDSEQRRMRSRTSIRWSQWMVDGTAVFGRPEEMNCSRITGVQGGSDAQRVLRVRQLAQTTLTRFVVLTPEEQPSARLRPAWRRGLHRAARETCLSARHLRRNKIPFTNPQEAAEASPGRSLR